MQAYYSDHHRLPLPAGHRFPMSKYGLLRARVEAECPLVRLRPAPPASDGELALAHTPAWIETVTRGLLGEAAQREIGFPWSPAMVARARHSVGATIAAARAALAEGVAAQLAGGTHHARADRGAGYCVFNDTAVAARLMQAEHHRTQGQAGQQQAPVQAGHRPVQVQAGHMRGQPGAVTWAPAGSTAALLRVAVIDLDVHQGDGTASIFRDDATVFTLSLHGARNYPARKETSNLDVELPDGCTDEPYLAALDAALAALWAAHGAAPPGLAFYLAGADPYVGDRLGRLALSAAGLAERDRRVLTACRLRGVPVVVTMAGGYGRSIDDTVAIHLRTLREALASWQARHAGGPAAMEQSGA